MSQHKLNSATSVIFIIAIILGTWHGVNAWAIVSQAVLASAFAYLAGTQKGQDR